MKLGQCVRRDEIIIRVQDVDTVWPGHEPPPMHRILAIR
jgi:hypothetical protein